MNGTISDEELVLAARQDKAALSELIARYIGPVRAAAVGMAPAVSDDLAQEGLMALVNAVKSYSAEEGTSFSAYAGVCIRNRMISARAKYSDESGELDEEELSRTAGGIIPEDVVVEQVRMDELYKRMSSALSEREWQVFRLFLAGDTYSGIAKTLGVSIKTVDNAMQRVRRKLKALL
ncbi:MAG: sigma-70 family RNA polymerase sigma factor [Ruminococcus sp.]|nr:sigma-70 family RNA polymerase sigma factor [Ruminococcus sp.]